MCKVEHTHIFIFVLCGWAGEAEALCPVPAASLKGKNTNLNELSSPGVCRENYEVRSRVDLG